MGGENQNIDLQKLSQRELLIVTYRKVEELSTAMSEQAKKVEGHEVKLAVIDTKVKTWAALVGAGVAIVIEIISKLINN